MTAPGTRNAIRAVLGAGGLAGLSYGIIGGVLSGGGNLPALIFAVLVVAICTIVSAVLHDDNPRRRLT